MECTEYQIWHKGKKGKWIPGNMCDLKSVIERWRDYVESHGTG